MLYLHQNVAPVGPIHAAELGHLAVIGLVEQDIFPHRGVVALDIGAVVDEHVAANQGLVGGDDGALLPFLPQMFQHPGELAAHAFHEVVVGTGADMHFPIHVEHGVQGVDGAGQRLQVTEKTLAHDDVLNLGGVFGRIIAGLVEGFALLAWDMRQMRVTRAPVADEIAFKVGDGVVEVYQYDHAGVLGELTIIRDYTHILDN